MTTKRKPKKIVEEVAVKPVQVKPRKPRKPKVQKVVEPVLVVEPVIEKTVPDRGLNLKKIAVIITSSIIAAMVYNLDYIISLIK